MPDWIVSLGVNALITVVRSASERSRWRRALLKVFKEIAQQFRDDDEFVTVMSENLPEE